MSQDNIVYKISIGNNLVLEKIENELITLDLWFESGSFQDVFKDKNNKSLAYTLKSKRYEKLSNYVHTHYDGSLTKPLGAFLYELKSNGDDYYKNFLNKYGDLEYSTFYITNPAQFKLKGIYIYYEKDVLRYIGRCKDSMQMRINSGYGKITPKNCYLDGQSTNCRINAYVTNARENITLKLYTMNDDDKIEILESRLIQELSPEWNVKK